MIQAVNQHWRIAEEYHGAGQLAAAKELSAADLQMIGSNVLDQLMEADAGDSSSMACAGSEAVPGHPSVLELAKCLLMEAAREQKRQPWSKRSSSCAAG